MSWLKNQSSNENLLYLVVWGMLFAVTLLSLYVRTVSDESTTFNWNEVLVVWKLFAVYLLLFLIHNFLLAPLLVYQHRRALYFTTLIVLVAAFVTYQCSSRPKFRDFMGNRPPKMEQRFDGPRQMGQHDNPPPQMENGDNPSLRDGRPEPTRFRRHQPPPFIGQHDIMAVVVLVLMFAANLGAKLYFRNRSDHKRLLVLEKQNLEQQLEYLKYQISPHFFMNTLNNIHALVDIDPSKAQNTIRELSKMMRFVLYESDKSGVPLKKELDFIHTYIKLMGLRYTDKVKITVDMPAEVPDKTIPPLMLISFIENAFKHGVSYRHESFIDVKVEADSEQLLFTCRNSKADKPNEEKGGVGLANVRQRLNLLYDQRYTLHIHDTADSYNVELTIPLS